MMRSQPRARTFTLLTLSGKRSSAGSLMAWLRLLVNTVVVVMVRFFKSYLDSAKVYPKFESQTKVAIKSGQQVCQVRHFLDVSDSRMRQIE